MPKSKIYTYSAPVLVTEMLANLAHYHQWSKSATIAALIKKEFWRVFPEGTGKIRLTKGARVEKRKGHVDRGHR